MSPKTRHGSGIALILIRYGIGAAMVIAGVVMIAVNPDGLGVDGFAMAVGGVCRSCSSTSSFASA